jgi:hypothetical protein
MFEVLRTILKVEIARAVIRAKRGDWRGVNIEVVDEKDQPLYTLSFPQDKIFPRFQPPAKPTE